MAKPKKKVAKAKGAAKTDKVKNSLVKCEVKLESGEWISPESCKTFYIDEDANFPDITYEIKTDEPGPYEWSWQVKWTGMACPQAEGKRRYKTGKENTYAKNGKFQSNEKKWKADLHGVLGGDLTVKVKAGNTTFVRKTFIRGKNPSKEKILTELDVFTNKEDVTLAKKIFQQESRFRQFYSDEAPLTSFDNGYGLGQLTNPKPDYEQVWNWKAHIKDMLETRIRVARRRAKAYLDKHPGYSQEIYDLETLAAYNGIPQNQRYHNWDEENKVWVINENVICDPSQSNKGWNLEKEIHKGKSLQDLKKDKGAKPFYTGRCYAEHVKNNQ